MAPRGITMLALYGYRCRLQIIYYLWGAIYRSQMAKVKYRYNPSNLDYEKVENTVKDRIVKSLSFMATGLVFAVIIIVIAYTVFDSPKEKRLKRENNFLEAQYNGLNGRFKMVEQELVYLQQRDDQIYREIFETPPVPDNIRKAGVGGSRRYASLEEYENSDLVISTTRRLDKITRQMAVQSESFDEVMELVKKKEDMIARLPAIIPIAKKDLRRMASGYGYRIDPFYKVKRFHQGMDFTSPTGTEILATADGKVKLAEYSRKGYGNHVIISHGYGYKTLYGHMRTILVKPGEEVKRSQVIGYVGNTGKSTAPHLHYEVHYKGKAINPVNFYHEDLDASSYEEMRVKAANPNQPLD